MVEVDGDKPIPLVADQVLAAVQEGTYSQGERQKAGVERAQDRALELEGVVNESLPNAMFRSKYWRTPILAHVSGKIRLNLKILLVIESRCSCHHTTSPGSYRI